MNADVEKVCSRSDCPCERHVSDCRYLIERPARCTVMDAEAIREVASELRDMHDHPSVMLMSDFKVWSDKLYTAIGATHDN